MQRKKARLSLVSHGFEVSGTDMPAVGPSRSRSRVVMGIMPHEDKKRKKCSTIIWDRFSAGKRELKKKKEDPATDSTMTMVLRPRVRVDLHRPSRIRHHGRGLFCSHDARMLKDSAACCEKARCMCKTTAWAWASAAAA